MIVREIQPGEENNWDQYVLKCPYSTPQHLFGWKKVMEEAFNSKTFYIVAEENGTIQGVLPLIHVKSLLAGNYVTSLPGGICTENDDAARQLYEYAREMVDAGKAKYLILRDGRKKWDLNNIVTDEEHVTFLIEVLADPQDIKSQMKKRTRQLINKIDNHRMMGKVGIENLKEYYPIYQRAMRDLGTPTLGHDFFNMLVSQFPGELDLISILHNHEILGGGFIHPFTDTVFCLWSGILHNQYKYHPSYLLQWKAINYAQENGYRFVDMGRCKKDSGGYDFKRGFGGRELQLYQQFYLNGLNRAPNVGGERKADIKYQIFIKIWRLLPLQITELLGPVLRKQMPFG